MSLGLHDPARRYRRRVWAGIARTTLYVVAIVAVGLFAYQTGIQQDQARITRLEDEMAALEEANAELEETARRHQEAARSADAARAAAERRYEEDMPTAVERQLLALIDERRAAGIPVDRIGFMIRSAAEPRACSAPENRRFILPSEGYQGPNTRVGFGGLISITGWGVASRSEGGGALAYFDPSQPVRIQFIQLSGEETVAEGVLPLTHSVIMEGEEWRFLVDEGDERSFVTVSAQRCAAP